MTMNVLSVASYICDRYKEEYHKDIDEMKLHKLLYFVQRECIVQTDMPLFDDRFEAWKYGPVMVCVRAPFKEGSLCGGYAESDVETYKTVFDKVFSTYAPKDSWSLSSISHNEYSWLTARKGCAPDEKGNTIIATEDIAKDAQRIKIRRVLLKKYSEFQKMSS